MTVHPFARTHATREAGRSDDESAGSSRSSHESRESHENCESRDARDPRGDARPEQAVVELVVLRRLPTAVRGRDAASGASLTWRRKVAAVVPGQRLRVRVEKEWSFRRTTMVGGPMLHLGFSLHALRRCGFDLPRVRDGRLESPGRPDPKLAAGLAHLARCDALAGQADLLDVLERTPGCLVAHAAAGEAALARERADEALAHCTAAVRLGHGALSVAGVASLDMQGEIERALVAAIVSRGRLLGRQGLFERAAADLRRALAWDPADSHGAGQSLLRIEEAARARQSAGESMRDGREGPSASEGARAVPGGAPDDTAKA